MPLGSKPALHPKIFSVHVSSHTTSDREPVSSHKTSDRQPATASVPAPGKRSGGAKQLRQVPLGLHNDVANNKCFLGEHLFHK